MKRRRRSMMRCRIWLTKRTRRCKQTLVENRVVLDKLAAMLMEKETVDAEERQELLATNDVKMASIA